MKYYKIDIKSHFPELGRIASSAEGKNVPEKSIFIEQEKGKLLKILPFLIILFQKVSIKKNTGNGLCLIFMVSQEREA